MSIHTILSQMEKEIFGYGQYQELLEVSIYRKDGKIISVPYNKVKEFFCSFATRIVEEVGKELIGEDEELIEDNKDELLTMQGLMNYKKAVRNRLRKEQRTKLQKMKG